MNGKKAQRFEFETWPHASKFGCSKVSSRREVTSGSIYPRPISDWLPEICVAGRTEELDHSGFVFDKDQMEFETLDSKIAQGILKIAVAEFNRRINFLEETQYKNKIPMLTGRQIMYQIFSYFNIKKKSQEPINLSDSMDVELYNDNLKMFN